MRTLRRAARPAIELTLALAATVGILALLHFSPASLILGAVLAMSLARNRLSATWRGRLEALVALPVLGLATSSVGLVLASLPILGAALFVAGMFLAIWLRRFGPVWSRIGTLIALPFVTLLIAPAGAARQDGVLGVVAVSLIALAVVVVIRVIADRLFRVLPAAPAVPTRESALRPLPSTRMAIQLAIALSAAFALGFWLFPAHWTWVVLTAYLVCAGNRGRADVLHKSGLRLVGAAAGTVVALLVAGHPLVEGPSLMVLVIALVGVGQWVRSLSYAWWALAMTLILSLLQSALGAGEIDLWPRILGILVGAICGLAASWFVLPIRSLGVLRRRIADLLAALSENADAAAAAARALEVAPPFRALARVPLGPASWTHPGRWVDLALQVTRAWPGAAASGVAREKLGAARQAIRTPEVLAPALEAVLHELA